MKHIPVLNQTNTFAEALKMAVAKRRKLKKVRLSNISLSHLQGFCLVYICSG